MRDSIRSTVLPVRRELKDFHDIAVSAFAIGPVPCNRAKVKLKLIAADFNAYALLWFCAGFEAASLLARLWDNSIVALCREKPYYLQLCGKTSFQHRLAVDLSLFPRWRNRIGEEDVEWFPTQTTAGVVGATGCASSDAVSVGESQLYAVADGVAGQHGDLRQTTRRAVLLIICIVFRVLPTHLILRRRWRNLCSQIFLRNRDAFF